MKNAKTLRSLLAAVLAAAQMITLCPVMAAEASDDVYVTNFTSSETDGDWQIVMGDEGAAVTPDYDEGYLHIIGDGNTFLYDAESPLLENGYVEYEMEVVSLNVGVGVRGDSDGNYFVAGHDSTGWSWASNSGNSWGSFSTLDSSVDVNVGTTQIFRLEYVGQEYRLLVDGQEVFHETISDSSIPTSEGQVGLRLWGDPDVGEVKIYSIEAGSLDEIVTDTDEEDTTPEEDVAYELTFVSDETDGDWIVGNAGSATITSNYEEGYLSIVGASSTNTYLYDTESPLIADGYVEYDLEVVASNMGFGARGSSSASYYVTGYDSAGWSWASNDGNSWGSFSQSSGAPDMNVGGRSTYRFEFVGQQYRVLVDGEEVYSNTITDSSIPTDAGYLALRLWGWGLTPEIKVYGVKYGTLDQIGSTEPDEGGTTDPDEGGTGEPSEGDVEFTFDTGDTSTYGGLTSTNTSNATVTFSSDKATVAKVDDNTNVAHAVFTEAPIVADGYFEADVTSNTSGRFGFIFRSNTSASQYMGIAYDVGTWKVFNQSSEITGLSAVSWSYGETKHVRIEYIGSSVTMYIDGVEALSYKDDDIFGADLEGQVGFRVWGYSTGTNQGNITVDNVKNGAYNAVSLSPESAYVLYDDAGTYDINVTLDHDENPFDHLEIGDTTLVEGEDYTVDGLVVTLKKELIETLKNDGTTEIEFHFELEDYVATFTLQVQAEPVDDDYYYFRDFADGTDGFTRMSGSGTVTQQDGFALISSSTANFIDTEARDDLYNLDIEFSYNPTTYTGTTAVLVRYVDENDWTAIGITGASGNKSYWNVWNSSGQSVTLCEDGNRVYTDRVVPYNVRIRVLENTVTIWFDHGEVYSGTVDILGTNAGSVGIKTYSGTSIDLYDIAVSTVNLPSVEDEIGGEMELVSDEMTVTLDTDFPRVIDYTLATGEMAYGQERPYYVVELNNERYTPEVSSEIVGNQAIYHMSVTNYDGKAATFDAIYTLDGNTLKFSIENVKDEDFYLYQINFPVHSLVSVRSTDAGATLTANSNDYNTTYDLTTAESANTYSSNSIVVMNTDEIAIGFNTATMSTLRGTAYQTMRSGEYTITGIWGNGYVYRGLGDEILDLTWSKVALGTDMNSDGKVDFQDGAILTRDYCAPDGQESNIQYSEAVMGSLNTIAMNVGSGAQYPFLRILDNVKKVSLGIDNFPQNIVVKGYNGQGHDSNNGDFAYYNEAAGGLDDFLTLIYEAQDYNTGIGVHINHTEVYPESSTYETMNSGVGGWAWYDSSTQVTRENDILAEENSMSERLAALIDDTNNMLSMIYVDVYFDNRWPMYTIVNQINSAGIAVGTEYVNEMVGYSVWGHHYDNTMADAGNLTRFVYNQYADIFGSDNIFRDSGSRTYMGINGWQYSYYYDTTMEYFFTDVLPNRFLVQYPVMQYESTTSAVLGENLEVATYMESGTNKITLDGNLVVSGDLVCLPFNVDGEEKLYHWNPYGGTSTWTLPSTFEGQTTVKVYTLSDNGRSNETIVDVVDGQITLTATAKTGYVVYHGDADVTVTDITTYEWSEGGYASDVGFDSYTPGYAWDIEGNASYVSNSYGNTEIRVTGTEGATLTQTMTGLIPGESYAATVYAMVSDGRTATLQVETDDGIVSNYMDRSNINYGLHHTSKYNSKYQMLKVNFVATSDTAVISLIAAEGTSSSAYVYFDDVRIVENTPSDTQGHTYFEDFENVTEGYGVFLATESDNSHLSELNEGVTDDTISGQFSLKMYYYGDYMRTAPYTVRLEPNTTYTAGLDFIGNSNAFTFAVKSDKASEAGDTANAVLASAICGNNSWYTVGSSEITFTTGDYDDYYFDITKLNQSNYVIDNFYVDLVTTVDTDDLENLYFEAVALNADDYTAESYADLVTAMDAAKAVISDTAATQDELTEAYEALDAAMDALVAYATDADRTALTAVIAEMKAVSLDYFQDDDNWSAFQAAIASAEELVAAETVTANELVAMSNALYAAKGNLVSVVNKDDLAEQYALASEVSVADVVDGTNAVAFTTAMSAAATALESSSASQEDVDAALDALTAAYEAIEPKESAAIRTTWAEIVARAESIDEDDYTEEQLLVISEMLAVEPTTWAEFDTVIATLNAILVEEADMTPAANVAIQALEVDVDENISVFQVLASELSNVKGLFFQLDGLTGVESVTVVGENGFTASTLDADAHVYMLAYAEGTTDQLNITEETLTATITVVNADGATVTMKGVKVSNPTGEVGTQDAEVTTDTASTTEDFLLADAKADKIADIKALLLEYDEAIYFASQWEELTKLFTDAEDEVNAMDTVEAVEGYSLDDLKADADAILTAAESVLAQYDLNGDGVVNYADITCISPYYGHDYTTALVQYDVTGDKEINSADYLAVYNNMTK